MANMVGADVEALRDLARRFRQVAEQFDNSAHQVTSVLGGTRWVGRDASLFRDSWDNQLRIDLHRVAEAVSLAGNVLWENADAQEQVSSSTGSSTGVGGGLAGFADLARRLPWPPESQPQPMPWTLGPDWAGPAPLAPTPPHFTDLLPRPPAFPEAPTPLPSPWPMPDPILLFPGEPLPFFDDPISDGWADWIRGEQVGGLVPVHSAVAW